MAEPRPVHPHPAIAGGPPGRYLPPLTALSDTVMMLRDGDLAAAFELSGIDTLTAEDDEMADLARAMAGIVARQAPDMALHIHRVSADAETSLPKAPAHHGPAALDRAQAQRLAREGLIDRRTMMTLTVRPPLRPGGILAGLRAGGRTETRAGRDRRADRLERATDEAMAALERARPRRLTLSSGDWPGLLSALLTGQPRRIAPPTQFVPLSQLLGALTLTFRDGTFHVSSGDGRDRMGAAVGVVSWPEATGPGMTALLDLPWESTVSLSWTPVPMVDALARIQRTARRMAASEDAAISQREALTAAADDLQSGRVAFGNVQLTVTLRAADADTLEHILAGTIRVIQERIGGVARREQPGLGLALFSQFPGNTAMRARAALMSSANFGDLAPLQGSDPGPAPDRLPWGVPLSILPTVRREPYRLSLHAPGGPGELTPGHTLVVGATGSGKTVTMLFLIGQAMRVPGLRVICLDRDRGMEGGIRALGGDYHAVRAGTPAGVNPFREAAGGGGISWLAGWVREILAAGSEPPDAGQVQAITDAVRANAAAPEHLRTFAQFRQLFAGLDDGGDMHDRLAPWDANGEFGWLMAPRADTAATRWQPDLLAPDTALAAWDLTEIMNIGAVRTAWLAHAFRRIERMVEKPPADHDRPRRGLEAPRRSVVRGTPQGLGADDAQEKLRAGADDPARQPSTRLRRGRGDPRERADPASLPNSRATADELAPLNLNPSETAILLGHAATSRIALFQADGVSTVLDLDLAGLGPWLGTLSGRGARQPGAPPPLLVEGPRDHGRSEPGEDSQ